MSARPAARRTPRSRGRIGVTWTVRARPLSDAAVRRTVRAALGHGARPDLAVDVVLVGDAALRSLHRRFLHKDSTTDVIAFDLGAEGGGPTAEIYVSVDRARAVARRRDVTCARELALYLVHGALHLCGFDDTRAHARARMRAAEARVLDELGFAVDHGPHP